MSLSNLHVQLAMPIANAIPALQSAGKLLPWASKHGSRSSRCWKAELEESMRNTLFGCTDLGLVRLAPERIVSPLLSRPPLPAHWRQSHVSAASFADNKRSASLLPSPRPSPLLLVAARLPAAAAGARRAYHTSEQRGFKTRRTVEAERARAPSISDRLRDGLLLSGNRSRPAEAGPLSAADLAAVSVLDQHGGASSKLKELSDKSQSAEEQQRLKLAFAEGYLSGGTKQTNTSWGGRVFQGLYNALRIAAIVLLIYVVFAGPGNNMFRVQFTSSEVMPEEVNVSFADVKGADEAKQELQDIVAYLRNPERFSALGGKLPKGVLLAGPPGTGKTLLARAVAGEADVPFFHAAGSEFDEIFVGQGARRVRDLFRNAKARAPCVLFIDEIDSVGGKRSASRHHPYANQTINQLLTEMDGFHSNEGVIVLGATNRPDHLDSALRRPGRFDVEINVAAPDLEGRKDIFHLYLDKITLGPDVDVDSLARGTIGFTGADIENMVNQAALRAAILQASSVCMKHLDWARDKVIMGAERKARIPDEETNLNTAYHEGGHTLVAHFTKHADPVHKVTIMPRSRSLGHTSQIPSKDQYQNTRAQILARMDVLMGGRAAEEILLGPEHVTTGASNDLERATQLATRMVKQFGMSDRVGLRSIPDTDPETLANAISDSTIELIDNEIKRLLHESYERAKRILKEHDKELKSLADALLKYETLDADDIKAILQGGNCKKAGPQ
ncbi:ATP-dependent zinc metalloprotease YME1L-like [Amphibalanus amphitrite]|uniref:ATP-dependent zinc metalloprotease YME1L-like n=1 Tax=Amphibalanus amphitrite TaxID=1232801 RepID=UPI001C91625D|nr:ATP-dependent zinc metalloprotease YME1L-like [Amphibalanus amphitrite]XP_043197198.1 ATP-dependent zinc metalloprotease YME1L-like [Amphibalanus amphitrite]